MRWQSGSLSWLHGLWLCRMSRHLRRLNMKTNEWWHSLSCCCCPMGVVLLHSYSPHYAVFVMFSAAFMLWTELEHLTWTEMSDGNVTSEQSAAGCNIAQAVVTQALWEALEQRMKYPSNSIAITPGLPALKKQQTYNFLPRGSLLFYHSSSGSSFFCVCVCKTFCNHSFTWGIVAPPGCTWLALPKQCSPGWRMIRW